MPYNNPLNREIANKVEKINRKYIEHTENSYDLKVAESNVGNANKKLVDEQNVNQERTKMNELEEGLPSERERPTGGALGSRGGFAHGTWRDTGFDKTLGAGNYKNGSESDNESLEGGYPIRPFKKALKRKSKIANPLDYITGIADIASQLPLPGISTVGSVIKEGTTGLKSLMKEKGGRKTIKKSKSLLLKRMMEGGKPSKKHVGVIKRRGRPSKMSGGAENLARTFNMINKNGITGSGRKIGSGLVPVAQMKSSTMSGFGKKNLRSEIVKQVMKDRGVNMIQASSIVKKEGLYKK